MRESTFQRRVLQRLRETFPGCIVLKNDASYFQGIPDYIVLYGPRWAALEIKQAHNSARQPNQAHWVRQMNSMSYSAFIFPGNEDHIFDELQRTLGDW